MGKLDGLQDEDEAIRVAFGIARYVVMESWRPGREVQVSDDNPGWDSDKSYEADETEKKLLMDRIIRMLPDLGDDCRRTVEMFLHDKSYDQMQKTLGVANRQTMYVRVHRCIKKLTEMVTSQPGGVT